MILGFGAAPKVVSLPGVLEIQAGAKAAKLQLPKTKSVGKAKKAPVSATVVTATVAPPVTPPAPDRKKWLILGAVAASVGLALWVWRRSKKLRPLVA